MTDILQTQTLCSECRVVGEVVGEVVVNCHMSQQECDMCGGYEYVNTVILPVIAGQFVHSKKVIRKFERAQKRDRRKADRLHQ